jgi:hypothetical protein
MPSLTGLGILLSISRHCRAGLQIVPSLRDWASPIRRRAILPPVYCNTNGVSTTGARGRDELTTHSPRYTKTVWVQSNHSYFNCERNQHAGVRPPPTHRMQDPS